MATFADRIKELRKTKGLKQSELADYLKITVRHYQDCEYGKVTPTSTMLVLLADLYDVSTDFILGRSDHPDRI